MALVTRVTLLISLNFLLSTNTDAYMAVVDFEIARFRILDRDKAAGGSKCDSDSIGPRYNPCDFVFYVKNCTQTPRDGGQQCTTRINRFYAPENTDDVTFGEGARPVTSIIIDSLQRESAIRVEVYDQDDGYSGDDPIGAYQLRVTPEAIDPRGQQVATVTEQLILIPDHSEMVVRYRAYCVDEECRSRRPGFEQGRGAGGFGSQVRNDQPAEAWTVSNNGKDPSTWAGEMRPAGAQQALSQQALAQQPFGSGRFGGQQGAIPSAQQPPGQVPVLPSQSPGHRPPFVEWPKTNSIGERPAGERSSFGGHPAIPAPPEDPFGPSRPDLPPSVVSALSSNSIGTSVEQIQKQIQAGAEQLKPGADQAEKELQSHAAHLLGFHCEGGRCSPDPGQPQQPFQSQQREQKQVQSQPLQESQSHSQLGQEQSQSQHNQEEHPFQAQWKQLPQEHNDQRQPLQQQPSDHQNQSECQEQQPQGNQSKVDSGSQISQNQLTEPQEPHEPGGTPASQQKLKEQPGGRISGETVITHHPSAVIQVMDNDNNVTADHLNASRVRSIEA